MPILSLDVDGYRSVRNVHLKLNPVNVIVGPNGCGKSNLYRSIFLLHAAANGQLARNLADEGGMPSVFWAGARTRNERVRLTLGVTLDQLAYELSLGLPQSEMATRDDPSLFTLDPKIKEESVWFNDKRGKVQLFDRTRGSGWARDANGARVSFPMEFDDSEAALVQISEPHRFPQLSLLRQEFLAWRFYHTFRTDADSPLRQPQIGVRTPVLSHDGRDLAAALQTIHEIGDGPALRAALERAFPGARLDIQAPDARFSISMEMPDFKRPFCAQELSDGTLRYLCLLAALLSPRPPKLLALNEPETSLHPDLLVPLAELIVRASQHSQMWVTTHSQTLANHIGMLARVDPIRLMKEDGETKIVGQGLVVGNW